MRYSQLSLELRLLLEDPENYPLLVTFLGKRGLLTFEEIAFLRRNGVDFDIDDHQVATLLEEQKRPRAVTPLEGEGPASIGDRATLPEDRKAGDRPDRARGLLVFLAVAGAIYATFRRIVHFAPR